MDFKITVAGTFKNFAKSSIVVVSGVSTFLNSAKYFEPSAIPIIRQKMENASDDALLTLQATELKDPTTVLLISIFLGTLGIDRFMIGDIGMGVLKLLTCGLCGA